MQGDSMPPKCYKYKSGRSGGGWCTQECVSLTALPKGDTLTSHPRPTWATQAPSFKVQVTINDSDSIQFKNPTAGAKTPSPQISSRPTVQVEFSFPDQKVSLWFNSWRRRWSRPSTDILVKFKLNWRMFMFKWVCWHSESEVIWYLWIYF